MLVRGGRLSAVRVAIAGAMVVAGGVIGVVAQPLVAHAVAPTVVTPYRVYGLVDANVPFVGTDPLSGDRNIDITGLDTPQCDNGAPDYVADGNECAGGFIEILNGTSHGTLFLPGVTTVQDLDGDDVFLAPGGAVISQHDASNPDLTANPRSDFLNIVGTQAQITTAYNAIQFDPEDGYEYLNSSYAVNLRLTARQGNNNSDTTERFIQVRILDDNDWPELGVPAGPIPVTAGPVGVISEDNDPIPDYGLESEDDDELNEPQGDFWVHDTDLFRGDTGDVMLLAMWVDCGEFHVRSASLPVYNDIENLLGDVLDFAPEIDQATRDTVIAAIMAVLPDEVANTAFASTDPDEFTTSMLGAGDLEEVLYALSQVSFRDTNDDETCTLNTFVTDLGGNGMPFQFLVLDADAGIDIEVPIPGFAWDETVYEVGEGSSIDASLLAGPINIPEGDADVAPVTITLTPAAATHPSFDLTVSATPQGGAVSGTDYDPVTTTVTVPADATSVDIPISTIEDAFVESGEGILLSISPPASPPAGYEVTTNASSVMVNIVDDDVAPGTIGVSIDDVAVTEGDSGTVTAVFTVSLDDPAVGGETINVATANGSATAVSGDYDAISPAQQLTFLTGETEQTVNVTVNGDENPEPSETFLVNLSAPTGLSIVDGQGVGTITNDDTASVISISDSSVSETAGTANAAVSMTNAAGRQCVVDVGSSNGSAVQPGDYTTITDTLTVDAATENQPVNAADDPDPESDETYTVTLTLDVGLSDPQCQLGDATATITITDNDSGPDTTDPTVTIDQAVAQSDPTSVSPILFTAVFDEPVSGFAGNDVDFTGSTAPGTLVASVSGGPSTYTVSVSGMTGAGLVTASIGVGAAEDAATNPSEASTSTDNTVEFEVAPPDTTDPTVTIDQAVAQSDPTSVSPILFTAVFDEPVSGFAGSDVAFTGSTAPGTLVASVSGGPSTYTVSVSGMTGAGLVTASIGVGAAEDAATNPSEASTSTDNTVEFEVAPPDTTDPTVTVGPGPGQADPTTSTPIVFTVQFSEPVVGFVTGDVTVGGTAGATTQLVASFDGDTYTVAISGMTGAGTVIASVAAGVADDLAGNDNTASNSSLINFEIAPGALVIDVPADITQNNDPGQAGAAVSYPAPTASGGAPPVVVVCDQASGAFYAIGTTTVACTATDADGAMEEAIVSGSFTITVVDAEPPTIADLPDLIRATITGDPVVVTFASPSASDNSGVAPTVSCSPPSGTAFAIGTATVTCTATDAAGLTASSSFTVTVVLDPNAGGSPPSGGGGGGGDGGTTTPIGTLPATGTQLLAITMLAAALTVAGLGLLSVRRRRTLTNG